MYLWLEIDLEKVDRKDITVLESEKEKANEGL
jgi:hypothetical protein